MNRKFLQMAVAVAITAPTSAFSEATFYGQAHVSLDYFDQTDFKGWTMSRGMSGPGQPRGSRIGIRGSEELGGLKGIYQIELGVPLANESDYDIDDGDRDSLSSDTIGGIRMRNSYVGLQGGFGTILAGRHDTPFKLSTQRLELFNDTIADYEGTIGFHDVRADNTVAYLSPDWSGFSFAAAVIPGSASTFMFGKNKDANSISTGYSVATKYRNGPWHASLAYEYFDNEFGWAGSQWDGSRIVTHKNFHKGRLGLGMVDFHGFTLAGLYEQWRGNSSYNYGYPYSMDANLWQVQAGYVFGNNMLKAMFGKANFGGPGDGYGSVGKKSWAVGLDHNFSKRIKAYLLYTDVDMASMYSTVATYLIGQASRSA